jgi:hypothetical protein
VNPGVSDGRAHVPPDSRKSGSAPPPRPLFAHGSLFGRLVATAVVLVPFGALVVGLLRAKP